MQVYLKINVIIYFNIVLLEWLTYIRTSQLFSWLQKGQLNCVSKGSIALLFGGGFLFDFLRPILYLGTFSIGVSNVLIGSEDVITQTYLTKLNY